MTGNEPKNDRSLQEIIAEEALRQRHRQEALGRKAQRERREQELHRAHVRLRARAKQRKARTLRGMLQ